MDEAVQIAKMVFEKQLFIMKQILRMGEFKFGRETEAYRFFKEQSMDYFYIGTETLFKEMEEIGLLKKCICKGYLRGGYSGCSYCSGAGYCNKDTKFNI